ncbi:MAG: LysE family translocator [Sulfurospirillum sp.]
MITLVFLLTSTVIILVPGQDMILVMSRSISQGPKAGIMTAFGVSVGLLGHTLLATFGLGALLLASEFLFDIVKFIGAGYLVYIGYQLLKTKDDSIDTEDLPKASYKKMFMQGVISNITNPKVAIFYFSYLPQFVVSNDESQTMQLFILGFTFAVLTFSIKAPIGFISGLLSFWIKTRPVVLKYIHRTSGIILIGLGFKLALQNRS